MDSIIVLFAILTFFSTLIGGFVILKFRKSLPYFFGFAAGSLMAVSFLDLLPESIDLANSINFPIRNIMLIILGSFFFYSLIEKFFLTHDIDECDKGHGHIMGPLGAGSLIIHSFLDGVAIGTAFHISSAAGILTAMAVIFHDFTDGINTVAIMLKNKQKVGKSIGFLVMGAVAPVLGVILATIVPFSPKVLVILLSIFIGEFIYLGAASLLPEAHHHPSKKIVIAVALGIIVIAVLTSFL